MQHDGAPALKPKSKSPKAAQHGGAPAPAVQHFGASAKSEGPESAKSEVPELHNGAPGGVLLRLKLRVLPFAPKYLSFHPMMMRRVSSPRPLAASS